jgi:hypothetical protein
VVGDYVEHEIHPAVVQGVRECLEVVGCAQVGVDAVAI